MQNEKRAALAIFTGSILIIIGMIVAAIVLTIQVVSSPLKPDDMVISLSHRALEQALELVGE